MDQDRLRELLRRVGSGEVAPDAALKLLEALPFADLGFARVDHHRALRQGLPEVILASGKTPEQIIGVARQLEEAGENILITRLSADAAKVVQAALPRLSYSASGRTATLMQRPVVVRDGPPVAVVTAGTSDIPVADEALETLRMAGIPTVSVFDVGVAGLHRLLASLDVLRSARAAIVIAGMEGALPSVVGGLVAIPVVAVPTSVGYGTALGGLTALFGMLTSCASGVSVVNIDNGFGAAMAIVRLLEAERRREAR
jgi:NCAIR mutase (PurE)-related protein